MFGEKSVRQLRDLAQAPLQLQSQYGSQLRYLPGPQRKSVLLLGYRGGLTVPTEMQVAGVTSV